LNDALFLQAPLQVALWLFFTALRDVQVIITRNNKTQKTQYWHNVNLAQGGIIGLNMQPRCHWIRFEPNGELI